MSRASRRKGVDGEREVAAILRSHGFELRGLEGLGDWLAMTNGLILHVECKRQEVARPWLWQEQALAEAPAGALPVVAFRRSRGQWWQMSPLTGMAAALTRGGDSDALR